MVFKFFGGHLAPDSPYVSNPEAGNHWIYMFNPPDKCFSHIGKAGKILMGNSVSQAKISLNSGVDGIGFACRF